MGACSFLPDGLPHLTASSRSKVAAAHVLRRPVRGQRPVGACSGPSPSLRVIAPTGPPSARCSRRISAQSSTLLTAARLSVCSAALRLSKFSDLMVEVCLTLARHRHRHRHRHRDRRDARLRHGKDCPVNQPDQPDLGLASETTTRGGQQAGVRRKHGRSLKRDRQDPALSVWL